jgi:hypothetical protein
VIRHWRARRAAAVVPAITPEFVVARLWSPRWKAPADLQAVKQRSHFGLRGAPQ